MKDLRVISARVLLPIESITPVRDFYPISVVAFGPNMSRATDVFYNGYKVDEFVVTSTTSLLVKVPESQASAGLKELLVLSDRRLASGGRTDGVAVEGKLYFPLQTLEGIDRLVQCWMMIFLTTPGSDIFDQDSGGGANSIIGRVGGSQGQSATSDLVLAVERTKAELVRKQSENPRIPLNERLLSCTMSSVSFDPQQSTLSAKVTLESMAGVQAELSVR